MKMMMQTKEQISLKGYIIVKKIVLRHKEETLKMMMNWKSEQY